MFIILSSSWIPSLLEVEMSYLQVVQLYFEMMSFGLPLKWCHFVKKNSYNMKMTLFYHWNWWETLSFHFDFQISHNKKKNLIRQKRLFLLISQSHTIIHIPKILNRKIATDQMTLTTKQQSIDQLRELRLSDDWEDKWPTSDNERQNLTDWDWMMNREDELLTNDNVRN